MGQYHKAYNIDKREFIRPHHVGLGLKLMEQVGFEKSTVDSVFFLLANSNGRGGGDAKKHPLIGHLAGDRIVVQGDYAEPDDPGYLEDTGDFTNISDQVMDMLKNVGY